MEKDKSYGRATLEASGSCRIWYTWFTKCKVNRERIEMDECRLWNSLGGCNSQACLRELGPKMLCVLSFGIPRHTLQYCLRMGEFGVGAGCVAMAAAVLYYRESRALR
jgi:hypothetical protein